MRHDAGMRRHRVGLASALLVLLAVAACSSSHQRIANTVTATSSSVSSSASASIGTNATRVSRRGPSRVTKKPSSRPSTSRPATNRPAPIASRTSTPGSRAPTAIAAAGSATIAGCALFPSDNAWRRDISRDPVDPHSAAWVASIGSVGHLHPDFGSNPSYGIPYSVVPASQPKVPIRFTAYGSESDPGPYPIPPSAAIEAGGDRHVLVASGDCHLYELFGAARAGSGWTADSGAVFDLRSDRLRPDGWTSADAAGLPILPGLVRRDEVQAGVINHALRFTVARTQRGFIHPATHQAGSTTDPNVPPMGARFRLKAGYDISRFHGAARVVLECLQRYGMLVADNGSNWFLSGATNTGWNDADLDQLKSVPGSAFEAVSSGPVLHG
jgi:hypothetical protein